MSVWKDIDRRAETDKLEIIIAWQAGYLSEGQAIQLTGLDHVGLREEMLRIRQAVEARWIEFQTQK